jgi:hypothetical protein
MKTNFRQSQDAFVEHPTNLATEFSMPLLLPDIVQEHPSIKDWSQERDSSESSKASLGPAPPKDRIGKSLSSEAIQRRQQQNRANQVAFRARTKKMVDDLQQQRTQCTEHNSTMYLTLQNLLENAELLKRAIEGALAFQRLFIFENQQEEKGMSQPSSPESMALNFGKTVTHECDRRFFSV